MGKNFMLFRKESGELVIKYWSKMKTSCCIPDCNDIAVNHPHADKICAYGNSATIVKYSHLLNWNDIIDEWFDTSEPRAPLGRAGLLSSQQAHNAAEIHDALQKAHERMPWHPKLNAEYAAIYFSMGYRGFAQFHMGVAYTVTPSSPIIAGMHFLLQKILNKQPEQSRYLALITDELGIHGFMRLASLANDSMIRFPVSYWEGARIAFPNNPNLQDRWSDQAW
jgi:hypothetical protein